MEKYNVSIPKISGGRAQNILTRTEHLIVGMNVYEPGRKISLHRHIGQDHTLLVLHGEASFYDETGNSVVCKKGEGFLIPDGFNYRFDAGTGQQLVLLRIEAKKGDKPKSLRVAADGHVRNDEDGLQEFFVLGGKVVAGETWEL